MISTREKGFTLIELLVVSIIVGILGTLVALAYSGVQSKNRNDSRQASINTLQGHLETYYAEHSKYPTLGQINETVWRNQNLKKFKDDTLRDPQWDKKANCSLNDHPTLADTPKEKCFSYQVTAADGSVCDNDKITCVQYTLTGTFEGGEKYVKTSIN